MGARKRLAAEARKEKNRQLCIAHLQNNNTSPRKTRLMADLVRGKDVEYALRIGGATFQIPSEIRPERKQSVGMKNMINFARKRHEKSMSQKLAAEIMAAYKNEGAAFKRKEDIHRMAEANKAFSHFRF